MRMLYCNTSDPGMYECKTLSMTLDDLMRGKANQMLKEIRYFDTYYHETSDDQTEILDKVIENLKQVNAYFRKKIVVDLEKGLEELKSKKEALNKALDEKDSRLDSLKKLVQQNKKDQEEELKTFNETHANNVQRFKKEFEREINEADRDFKEKITEIRNEHERLNQDIKILKKDNAVLENELKDEYYYQSYIGRVCLTLQTILYHIVLPKQFVKDLPYKVKDIEEDIDDDNLLNEEEKKKASKRWEDLKDKLRWEPSLEKTLKILQKEGNPRMIRPENLTVEEAERAVEELSKQGILGGRTSHEKVKKIIEMWKTSIALVLPLQ